MDRRPARPEWLALQPVGPSSLGRVPGDEKTSDTAPTHWLIERRVRVFPRLLLVMFVLTVPLYALTFEGGLDGQGRPMGTDFIAFWSAARVTVEGAGIDPWSLLELERFQLGIFPGLEGPTAWVYPPTMLLLVWPLGHLPFVPAFLAWTSVGLVAYLVALRPLLSGVRHAWLLALAFPGLWLGIAQGQTQFVVSALMGGALLLLGRHPVLAGVLVGLMTIKPHLAILFPLVLVAGSHWRTFLSAAVTAVTTFALAVVAFGQDALRSWVDGMGLVGSAIDVGALPVYKFVTPYTSFRLLGIPEVPSLLLHVCVALSAAWVVWTLWRRSTDIAVRGSALVLGTFLVSPYAADYDLAVLAFPIAWMALTGIERGWLRGDRNLLALAWMLPIVVAPIAAATHAGTAPIVLGLMLWQLWKRVSNTSDTGQECVDGVR
jgi:hypothetical protein